MEGKFVCAGGNMTINVDTPCGHFRCVPAQPAGKKDDMEASAVLYRTLLLDYYTHL